jgi:carbonic anhydrase
MSDFQPQIDTLVTNNAAYAADQHDASLPGPPQRQIAVVTCMDARVDPLSVLGLNNGEAHIIRNAGGIATDDAIRSLCLSQKYLGTREIVLIHHSDCGLQKVGEEQFRADLLADYGVTPPWAGEMFTDAAVSVRQSAQRIINSPFVPITEHLSGYVLNLSTGLLEPVEL